MEKYTIQLSRIYSDSAAKLPKNIRAKLASTLDEFYKNPQSKGLHIENLSNSDLRSARVDENYRIIFAQLDKQKLILLLYVDSHDRAYRWAETHHAEINPLLGSVDIAKTPTPKVTRDPATMTPRSRLSALWDKHLLKLGVPEEYWPQLRTRVFNKAQLTGYKSLLSEAAYHTMEYILEGETVENAMQLYDLETETVVPVPIAEKEPLFAKIADQDLIKVGIPTDSVPIVKLIKTEKELEHLSSDLPLLAVQSLYALLNGSTISEVTKTNFASAKPLDTDDFTAAFNNPITLAEFAPINSEEALRAISEYPSEKWRVFLHPLQRQLAQRDYNGAAQVIGGAGTGKTVVIVHRAKYLASLCTGDEKIFVTSFNKTLTADIKKRLNEICSEEELKHIYAVNVDKAASDYARALTKTKIIYNAELEAVWKEALASTGLSDKFAVDFCMDEFRDVIQEQNLSTLPEYLETQRYGRGKQFDRRSREEYWTVAKKYIELCNQRKVADVDRAENILTDLITADRTLRYKSVLIDECQDLRAPALRMLRALAGDPHENDLYLSGDSRQRIYNSRTSLLQCGIVINNRSRTLKLNYRTTAEIYEFAIKLQEKYSYDDMNGQSIDKIKNDCVFRGSKPVVKQFASELAEAEAVIRSIRENIKAGVREQDICIMLRSNVTRYAKLLQSKGLPVLVCSNQQADDDTVPGVRLMTMHRSKGLEYTFVYLPCLNYTALPPTRDLEKAQSDGTEQELMVKESNILSVAITRAKRFVWLSYSGRPSVLLSVWEELQGASS